MAAMHSQPPQPAPPAARPRARPPGREAAVRKPSGFLLFPVCAGLSLLAALLLLPAWLLEKSGAFFRRMSWRLDVAANTVDAWRGPEEE
jgi:hypothetical protein